MVTSWDHTLVYLKVFGFAKLYLLCFSSQDCTCSSPSEELVYIDSKTGIPDKWPFPGNGNYFDSLKNKEREKHSHIFVVFKFYFFIFCNTLGIMLSPVFGLAPELFTSCLTHVVKYMLLILKCSSSFLWLYFIYNMYWVYTLCCLCIKPVLLKHQGLSPKNPTHR